METILLVGIVVGLAAGIFITNYFSKTKEGKLIKEQSSVLVNKIKQVCKLITVEGEFSEILTHRDEKPLLFKLVQLEKKALIIVKAKVMVGFDLSGISIKVEPKSKTILLSKFPDSQILSLDTDIEYYDIKKGIINKFSESDLTLLNQRAKEHIRNKTEESSLFNIARNQASETIALIKSFTESSNWKIVTDVDHKLGAKDNTSLQEGKR